MHAINLQYLLWINKKKTLEIMKKIKVGSDFIGVGAFDQSLIKLGIDYETVFACDMDKYAQKTFIANYGEPTQQMLEINDNGVSNCLTTVQKDNVVVVGNQPGKHEQNSRIYGTNGVSPTLTTMQGGGQEPKISTDYRIRKLTPLECSRLMAFPDTLVNNARNAGISDSQLYKQAGNSIVVDVLAALISRLNP